jgi:hypothetical protein
LLLVVLVDEQLQEVFQLILVAVVQVEQLTTM